MVVSYNDKVVVGICILQLCLLKASGGVGVRLLPEA